MSGKTSFLRGLVILVATVGTALAGGCGDDQGQQMVAVDVAQEGAFRVVETAEVGLNGAENGDRPPVTLTLVGSAKGLSAEAALVDRYVEGLRGEGWALAPHEVASDWWTVRGTDGDHFVRVGPASRFAEMATIEEGFARTKFRERIAEDRGPLIVVSIDPSG